MPARSVRECVRRLAGGCRLICRLTAPALTPPHRRARAGASREVSRSEYVGSFVDPSAVRPLDFLAGLEGEVAPAGQVGVVGVAGRSGWERGPSCPAGFGQRQLAGFEVFEAVHATARKDLG